jgi:hypothetical protein
MSLRDKLAKIGDGYYPDDVHKSGAYDDVIRLKKALETAVDALVELNPSETFLNNPALQALNKIERILNG